MINNVWLYLIAIMLVGTLLKSLLPEPLVWVAIDIGVLAACWYLLRRYPFIDLKRSLTFLGGLTAINILCDLNIISNFMATIIILAIICWLIFGGRFNGGSGQGRPKLRHKWHK